MTRKIIDLLHEAAQGAISDIFQDGSGSLSIVVVIGDRPSISVFSTELASVFLPADGVFEFVLVDAVRMCDSLGKHLTC